MAFLSYSGTSLLTMWIFVGVVGEGVGDKTNEKITRWWFQIFFIFTPSWGRFPIWLIFFRWVETPNQKRFEALFFKDFSGTFSLLHRLVEGKGENRWLNLVVGPPKTFGLSEPIICWIVHTSRSFMIGKWPKGVQETIVNLTPSAPVNLGTV